MALRTSGKVLLTVGSLVALLGVVLMVAVLTTDPEADGTCEGDWFGCAFGEAIATMFILALLFGILVVGGIAFLVGLTVVAVGASLRKRRTTPGGAEPAPAPTEDAG